MEQLTMQKELPNKVDLLMWQVTKLLTRSKRLILDEFDLTNSQYEMLAAIDYFSQFRSNIIQIDLSEETNIDPMTTSNVLRNLEKRGLITRNRCTVNTRNILIQLTDKGSILVSKASSKVAYISNSIYHDLDKEHLTSQLLKLTDKLNKLNH